MVLPCLCTRQREPGTGNVVMVVAKQRVVKVTPRVEAKRASSQVVRKGNIASSDLERGTEFGGDLGTHLACDRPSRGGTKVQEYMGT